MCRMRKPAGWVVVLLAASGPMGCDHKAPASKPNAAQPRSKSQGAQPQRIIGASLLTAQHQFYQELRAGLEKAATAAGHKLIVVSAEFDAARQANQIDEFIVQKVDAIVLSPCDSKSIGATIVAANQAGIPIFTADIANTSPLGKVVSHVASDNLAGGREAAKLLARAVGEKGAVAILSHPEVASVSDRVRGFKEQLAAYPGLTIAAELSAEGKRDKAVRVMEDLLQSNPEVAGVFGINDDTALGALAAIESAGKLGKIKIVGYDATPEARTRISSGAIFGDVIQNASRIGELTIRAIDDHFSGRSPPPVIAVEVGTFTTDDARPAP